MVIESPRRWCHLGVSVATSHGNLQVIPEKFFVGYELNFILIKELLSTDLFETPAIK